MTASKYTKDELLEALEEGILTVTYRYDFEPSKDGEEAANQETDFSERAWAALYQGAMNRAWTGSEEQKENAEIEWKRSGFEKGGLCVKVLSLDAAWNLEVAGFELDY